jgi:hypothetical protein
MKRNLFFLFIIMAAGVAITWKVFAGEGKKQLTAADIIIKAPGEETESTTLPEPELEADEKEILETMKQLFDGFGDSTAYSYANFVYNYNDPADSSLNIHNVEMEYCVKPDSTFYTNGDMIATNIKPYYIEVNRMQRRIIIAPAKNAIEMADIPLKMAGKFYKSNGYTMERTVTDSTGRIHIYNSNHLNCKEIVIDYNPANMKPVAVKYTLTDIDDPFNDQMNKTMRIAVREWTRDMQEVRSKKFPQALQVEGKKISATAGYKNFGIINLFSEQ